MTDETRSEMPGDFDRDLQAQLETVIASYFKRLQDARGLERELERCKEERRALQARADSQKDVIHSLEQQLLASQAREASALERIGVLTGVMQTHSASIADIVGAAAKHDAAQAAPETPETQK